jgi:hypothetical protein
VTSPVARAKEKAAMRNQIGIPPVDRQVDNGTPLVPGSAAPKVPHPRLHAGMDPSVAEAARHDDLPYVGGFDKPITERDTNVGLYVGIAIGLIALVMVAMVFATFF